MNKAGVKFLLAAAAVLIGFILFNQFDAYDVPGLYTEQDLGPPIFDKTNGFYLLFSLWEPPDSDVRSDAVINRYRAFFDPVPGQTRDVEDWVRMAGKGVFKKYEKETRFVNRSGKDWAGFTRSNRAGLRRLETRLSFLLERYRRLLGSGIVSDFSTPRLDITYLYPDRKELLTAANLYTCLGIGKSLDGDPGGVQDILAQVNFAKKLIASARSLYTNRIGKDILKLSLEAANNLMNQKECPREVFLQVFNALKPLAYEDFGSRGAFIGYYLAVERWLGNQLDRRIEKGNIEVGKKLGLAARLFLQRKRTQVYYFNYISRCIRYETLPPYKWEMDFLEAENLLDSKFWWLRNPTGKFIFTKELKPGFYPDILKSQQLRILYQLTRISAEIHLKYPGKKGVEKTLDSLVSYRVSDPYSGKSYIWKREKNIIYSIGTNRRDDGGKYRGTGYFKEEPPDIAVPCILF